MIESLFNKPLDAERKLVEALGFNPYYRVSEGVLTENIEIHKKQLVDLASNNYLGIADNGKILEAMKLAIDRYGSSRCGTPIAVGSTNIAKEAERTFSRFGNFEDSIIFPSGYQANVSTLGTLLKPSDVVIPDHFSHSSLIEGCRLSGAKIKPFRHNSLSHLEQVLKASSQYDQKLIVTESVFSTEGSIAPLKEIVELSKLYGAHVLVDDSHGVGVIGATGRGVLEHCGISDFQGIYTASLGKAIGVAGGVVSGAAPLLEYLRYRCQGYLYSTATLPALHAGIIASLGVIEEEFKERASKMEFVKNLMEGEARRNGIALCESKSAIVSLKTGTIEKTFLAAQYFYERGVLTTPFVQPSVPTNQGVVRLIARANLSEDSLAAVVDAICNFPQGCR